MVAPIEFDPAEPEREPEPADSEAPTCPPLSELDLAPAPDDLLGRTVGSYRLEKLLGRGGMGSVYLGVHPLIGSKVAVKFLHGSLTTHEVVVRRFFAEARASNRIESEHVVKVLDLGLLPPNRHFLVMEHLEGQTLGALLEAGPLDLRLGLKVLLTVCETISAAHAAGVVHRDLKPDNVFLARRSKDPHFVKVMDFGIARLKEEQGARLTAAGTVMGTPEYMAPEQCAGEEVDGRADVYALGVIAYQLSTGRLPFTGRNVVQVLLAQQSDPPRPPRELRPDLPPAWEAAVLKALAKRPEDRFQSAGELAEALRAALQPARPPQPAAGAQPFEVKERLRAEFEAEAAWAGQAGPAPVRVADLSRGGAFVRWSGRPPALFSRVQLTLRPRGEPALTLAGEVVRQVSEAEASAWRLSAGFALQFAGLGPSDRTRLESLLRPLPPAPAPSAPPSRDGRVEAVLDYFRKRASAGHYEYLGVAPDASRRTIESRLQALRQGLDALPGASLSTTDAEQLAAARARLEAVAQVLLTPARRLDYDASRGNHRGVARALAEGLSRSVIQAKRTAFLLDRRDVEGRVSVLLGRARLARGRDNLEAARSELQAALALDPLNLELHDALAALAPAHRSGVA